MRAMHACSVLRGCAVCCSVARTTVAALVSQRDALWIVFPRFSDSSRLRRHCKAHKEESRGDGGGEASARSQQEAHHASKAAEMCACPLCAKKCIRKTQARESERTSNATPSGASASARSTGRSTPVALICGGRTEKEDEGAK